MEKRSIRDRDEREVHDLGEHILLFENYFNHEFCEDCIHIFNECLQSGLVIDRDGLSIKDKALIHTQIPASSLPLVKPLQDIITLYKLPEFLKKYDIAQQYAAINIGGAKLQRTLPSEGYHVWHVEHGRGFDMEPRAFVFSIYLNDVDSGFTDFKFQNKSVKSEKGTLVIWPAYFTHEHRASTELKSDKYILTGWVNYER